MIPKIDLTDDRDSPVAGLAPWVQFAAPAAQGSTVLLCFPHAGGGATAYRRWPAALTGHGIETWPVQLPGRESRYGEPLPTDLAALVTSLVEIFAGTLRERPYAAYGHSAGALLAYAFGLRAAAHGLPAPRHLFLGAQRPLSHPDPDTPIHLMPGPALLAKLESYGGMPPEVLAQPDLVDLTLRVARADLRLVETAAWPTGGTLACPVTVLGGVADHNVPVELLPYWREVTAGPFEVVLLPGGHFPSPAAERRQLEVVRRALG